MHRTLLRLVGLVILMSGIGGAGCASGGGADTPPAAGDERFIWVEGGIVRGDVEKKSLALVFTGDEHADGGDHIRRVLKEQDVAGSFFLTGNFYRNPDFAGLIEGLREDGHYLGAHSDRHLLYCTWEDRDQLLVTHDEFVEDLDANYREMARFGIERDAAPYFMPPYEWYNAQISQWAGEQGITIVNFTPGTRSNADYTTPDMGQRYVPSDTIYQSILDHEAKDPHGLNGFLLLIHLGTAPQRTDKFYGRLNDLITTLKARGYRFERVDDLLAR